MTNAEEGETGQTKIAARKFGNAKLVTQAMMMVTPMEKERKINIDIKGGGEEGQVEKQKQKVPEETPPTDYVRVRARRGEATDSHSLAERVRRQKLSDRMKLLQSLVPGCDKITGKALILDAIIKYVRSLQNQVEFLAANLASVNPIVNDFEVDFSSMETLASENLYSLEPPLPSVIESSSTQFSSFTETTPTSTSFIVKQEQNTNLTFQDGGNLFWGMDNESENVVTQYDFDNFCSF